MAEWTLIQTRNISGSGVLQIPAGSLKFRATVLYLDLLRYARNRYENKNWNPPKGKYAFLTFLRNNYVIASDAMEFDRQAYDGIQDIAGQTLIAVKCAYEGTLISIRNLGQAQGLTPVQYTDLIKDYENLTNSWQEVRIKCYADTAIQARLYTLQYDTCDPAKDKQKTPPLPPPPPPRVPPGTPLTNISQPYDRFNNDSGNTSLYTGDTTGVPPSACQTVTVVYRADWLLNGNPTVRNGQFTAKAEVTNVYLDEINSGGSSVWVVDRSGASNTCLPTPAPRRADRIVGTLSNLQWYVQ